MIKHGSSLRVRLLLIVLVAVAPLFGLSVYWAMQDEDLNLSHARSHLQSVAASEAARQDREAESARVLLVAVAHASDVRAGPPSGCQDYLESLRESFAAYNVGVLNLDGSLRCSVRSRNRPFVDSSQVPYFKEALRTHGFAVGGYMPGILSGRPVFSFGYPVTSAGVDSGVVFVSTRLEDMQRTLREANTTGVGAITLLDRQARVLASTDARFAVGAGVPSARLKQLVHDGIALVEEAPDPIDGSALIHALAPARAAADGAIFVHVAVQRSAVIAEGRERLHAELASLCLVTALGAWLAWLYAGRQIVRPAREILHATALLRNGELATRVPGASDTGIEFERIAAGLNQMAQSLEERDHALNAALAENASVRATQDLVLNTMLEGVVAIDTRRNFLIFNKAAAAIFEQPDPAAAMNVDQPSLSGIFKPGTQTLFRTDELPLFRALRGESGSDFDLLVRNRLVPEGRLLRGNYRPIVGPEGIVGGMGVFTDITGTQQLEEERRAGEAARAAAEKDARENAERLARLVEVQTELAEADVTAEGLMDRMAALAVRVTGAPGADFELIAGEDFVLRSSAGTARRQPGSLRRRGQLSRDAIHQWRVVRCDDVEFDERVDVEWCRRHGVRSLLGGAIRVDSHAIGGIVLLSGQPHGFSRADAHVLELLCEFLGALLQRRKAAQAIASLLGELQEFNRNLEAKVTERTREVANKEAIFRAVADQAPQVMWIVTSKGAVTYLNRFWYDLVGGAPPKWLRHEWMDAVDAEDVRQMRAKWEVCQKDHSVFTGLRRVRAHDGTIHTLVYRASPVHDETGAIICWVGLDADITESQLVEKALRVANEELEAFSYSVSHDLRSPLNTIDGFSRLLEKDLKANDGRKTDHYISRIKAAAGHMGELIEGLLALAQVSRQNLKMTTVDMSAMCEEIADRLGRHDPERKARWQIEPGMTAHGDARLLRALLDNLLGNAWKFSSKVIEAEISVGCVATRGKAPTWHVRDNGSGFDMQYADKLFGTFQRLHGQSEFSGTGIGLATVKRIVARHGGTVWAEARPDEGATFFFTLDAHDGQAAAPKA